MTQTRQKRGALERVTSDPVSRRRFMALAGGGGAASLSVLLAACGSDSDTTSGTTSSASSQGGKTGTEQFGKGDVGILNYALTLEYLETAFYADVVKSGLFKGAELETIKQVRRAEEAEHVAALTAAVKKLGGKPAPQPKTKFPLNSAQVGAEAGRHGREPRRRRLPRPGPQHQEPPGAGCGAGDPQRSRGATPRP